MNTTLSNHIRIKRAGNKIAVWGYYHPILVQEAKSLQGEWRPTTQCWEFNSDLLSNLSTLLEKLFYVNGLKAYPTCRLRVNSYSSASVEDACMLFDRPIVRAFSRDSGAILQPDIYMLEGAYISGGSQKNWRTILEKASFEIHHFPLAALNREDVKIARQQGWVELLK